MLSELADGVRNGACTEDEHAHTYKKKIHTINRQKAKRHENHPIIGKLRAFQSESITAYTNGSVRK